MEMNFENLNWKHVTWSDEAISFGCCEKKQTPGEGCTDRLTNIKTIKSIINVLIACFCLFIIKEDNILTHNLKILAVYPDEIAIVLLLFERSIPAVILSYGDVSG